MQIYTVWIKRKGMPDYAPELIEAWDEFGIEENYEGWRKAYQAAVESIGSDLEAVRVIALDVRREDVERAFEPPGVEALVAGVIDPPTETCERCGLSFGSDEEFMTRGPTATDQRCWSRQHQEPCAPIKDRSA